MRVVAEHINSLNRQADLAAGHAPRVHDDLRTQEIKLRKAVRTIESHFSNY